MWCLWIQVCGRVHSKRIQGVQKLLWKVHFVILSCHFFRQNSVDIHKTSLFLNFQLILMLCLWIMHTLLHHFVAYKFMHVTMYINQQFSDYFSPNKKISKKYFAHKNCLPKGYWCKKLNFFWRKWRDKAVDHEIHV